LEKEMKEFEKFSQDQLSWLPESGIGYYPVKDSPYDEEYFAKYQRMAETEMGKALTKARVDLVNKYTLGEVTDIGIGSGAFVEARENTFGFDINPHGINWLAERGKYRLPNDSECLTFWDSLEHIHEPKEMLKGIKKYAFISIPIFTDQEHVLRSKHFRKDEHCWYFTEEGLKLFMWYYGFHMLEKNTMETELGREDINTYVFKKSA